MPRLPMPVQPREDETLSSWIQRLACAYHLTVREFVAWLGAEELNVEAADVDLAPPQNLVNRLADATDTSPAEIMRHCASRRESTLERAQRIVFCPLCWDDDVHDGIAPYVRLRWIDAWCVHCEQHSCHLQSVCDGVELSNLPFMACVWMNDIDWAQSAGLPFNRRLVEERADSYEEFKRKSRIRVIAPTRIGVPSAFSEGVFRSGYSSWLRFCWHVRSGQTDLYRDVSTPMTVVADLVLLSSVRFGCGDALVRFAGSVGASFGRPFRRDWSSTERMEPAGGIQLRASAIAMSFVLWKALCGGLPRDLAMALGRQFPLAQTREEALWIENRVARWPPRWRQAWTTWEKYN